MKTALVFAFALLAVACARSMTEESLLHELKDLLKRQVEEEGTGAGPGGRPPRPDITCTDDANVRDVFKACVESQISEEDRRQVGQGPPGGRRGGNPYCRTVERFGEDGALAIASCVQEKCTIPEEFQPQNIDCEAMKKPEITCADGADFREVKKECFEATLSTEERRMAVRSPGPRKGKHHREHPYCKLAIKVGKEAAATVSQCIESKCTVPEKMKYTNANCSAESVCLADKMESCRGDLELPESRSMGRRKDPFCFAVNKFGAAAATQVHDCLVRECGIRERNATDCVTCQDGDDIMEVIEDCKAPYESLFEGLRGDHEEDKRKMGGKGHRRGPHPYCKLSAAVGEAQATTVFQAMTECVEARCTVPADNKMRYTNVECPEETEEAALKRKLIKLLLA